MKKRGRKIKVSPRKKKKDISHISIRAIKNDFWLNFNVIN